MKETLELVREEMKKEAEEDGREFVDPYLLADEEYNVMYKVLY